MKLKADELSSQLREALERYRAPSYLGLFSFDFDFQEGPFKTFYQPYQSNELMNRVRAMATSSAA